MKKFFSSLALIVALGAAGSASAATIERDSDGDLEINVFANIIESFRVTITDEDLEEVGAAPTAQGFINFNGGLDGYDALKSIAAGECRDDLDASPTFNGSAACAVDVGATSTASDSKLLLSASMDVKVEVSGTALIDLSVAMLGVSQLEEVFSASAPEFVAAAGTSIVGMQDQDTDILRWHGEAALNGGPGYDDTIVVSVTKQP